MRLPVEGLGVPGSGNREEAVLAPRLLLVLAPKLVDELKDDLRLLFRLAENLEGLPFRGEGEYDCPLNEDPSAGLPRPDSGEPEKLLLLAGEPARDGVREYLGGVL